MTPHPTRRAAAAARAQQLLRSRAAFGYPSHSILWREWGRGTFARLPQMTWGRSQFFWLSHSDGLTLEGLGAPLRAAPRDARWGLASRVFEAVAAEFGAPREDRSYAAD